MGEGESSGKEIGPKAGNKHLQQGAYGKTQIERQQIEGPVQWKEEGRLAIGQQRSPAHDIRIPQWKFHPMKGFLGNSEKR